MAMNLNPRDGWLGWWPSHGWRAVLDPENGRIRAFLEEEVQRLAEGARVLDAGAGRRPYAGIFRRQEYESCDVPDGFYPGKHEFECPLDNIPRPNASYDAIVLTQVLEHVAHPEAVLEELKRVLKPGGVLLLSVPLNAPLHGEPRHFFQFTHYGLAELARRTDFAVEKCEKVGGTFWLLGKRVADLPRQMIKQVDPFRARKRGQSVLACIVATLLWLPFWLILVPLLGYLFRPLCYWMDLLDLRKTFTTGYTAVFRKLAQPGVHR